MRHSLDDVAVGKLIVGLVADPLSERTELGVGTWLEAVVGVGHLLGRLRHVPFERAVGGLHAGRESLFLPRRRRLGGSKHGEHHQPSRETSHSLHESPPSLMRGP